MQVLQQVEMNKYTNPHLDEDDESETQHSSVQVRKGKNFTDEDLEQDDFEVEQQYKPHFGNNFVCLFIKGNPLITLGPHWPLTVCMIVTFGMTSYFMLFFIAPQKPYYLQIASWVVAVLQMLSYICTALKNPGIVTGRDPVKDTKTLQCLICRVPRSAGPLFHCDDCDVCVLGYDHHCPWTGKCIAEGNLIFFYIFIVMIPVYFVFFVFITVV